MFRKISEWRYEIKFVINQIEFSQFISWLSSKKTIVKSFNPRFVNSIYFDDFDLNSMADNLSGIASRKKYRIRWYNSFTKKTILQFEIKNRNGRVSKKEVFFLKKLMINPFKINLSLLNKYLLQPQHNLSSTFKIPNLHPVVMTKYQREYYSSINDLKITFDSHLEFKDLRKGHDYFKLENCAKPVNILEFKFPISEKSNVSDILKDLPFTAKRNSKYLLASSRVGEAVYI